MTDVKMDMPFEEVTLEPDDGVYLEDDKFGTMKVSEPIWIESCERNIDNDEMTATIMCKNLGRKNKVIAKREEYLDPRILLTYQKVGFDVNIFNKNTIVKHLINEEKIMKIDQVHSQLGFGEHEGKTIYKAHNSIGTDSTYRGSFDINPKGNKDVWLTMLEDKVLGNVNLELICSISLTSILLGFIGEEYSLETIIVHLVGNSTTGKSTALRLAISIFGSIKLGNNSLLSTYNTTHNAMMKKLCGTKGVTFAFDEISISNIGNFTQTIYTLSQGVDKARLNKNSEQKEQESWLGTILSNGEKSLLNSANKNAGIQIRVIEIEDISWTSSAENAEEINRIVAKNSGHIAIEIAEYMMELGKEEVSKRYEKNVEMIKQVMIKNNLEDEFTSRRANKLATITTTAKIFQEYLSKEVGKEIKLDIKGMIQVLTDVERESIKSRNLDKSALEHIRQYILDNKHKFEKNWEEKPKGQLIGKLTRKKDYLELEMTPSKFKEMLKEGGYESDKVVLKELKNKGMLDCDSDRYTRKRNTDAGNIPVIVVKLLKKDK
ncbi:DUF927 domain-containing protein [Romboutsia sp.]|uniref:DUF927 domain-containing protein n=1 Tax=Romboutsia sp. TaxID=1965302 RepID=UPI003F3A2E15